MGASQGTGGETEQERENRVENLDVPFGHISLRFSRALATLRDFYTHVGPSAHELDSGHLEDSRNELLTKLRLLAKSGEAGEAKVRAVQDLVQIQMKRLEEFRKTTREWQQELSNASKSPEPILEMEHSDDPEVDELFDESMKVILERRHVHRDIFNGSVVMSLIGHAEVMIGSLIREFYKLSPDALTTDDKVLSLGELKSLGTVEAAIDFLIDKRVDDYIRQGIGEWAKFVSRYMKNDIQQVICDWPSWCEVFQRRHLLVHGDGYIDDQYLSKVDWSSVAPRLRRPLKGTHIHVDNDYVSYALSIFEASGERLCQIVWRKLQPGNFHRLEHLHNSITISMREGRWPVVESLSRFGVDDGYGEENDRLIFQFNYWLAVKRQDRWNEVKSDVDAFDTSAKHPKFALVRASLLERSEEFFKILPSAELSEANLRSWPILDEMRADARFPKIPDLASPTVDLIEDLMNEEGAVDSADELGNDEVR